MFLIFVYRNPPKVSPGLILGGGLIFGGGGLTFGVGAYFREKNCVSRKGSRTLNSKIRPDI